MFFAMQSIIFNWLPSIASGHMLAGSFGLLNCLGLCGGFLGPFILGAFEDRTGAATSGLWFAVALLIVGALVSVFIKFVIPGSASAKQADGEKRNQEVLMRIEVLLDLKLDSAKARSGMSNSSVFGGWTASTGACSPVTRRAARLRAGTCGRNWLFRPAPERRRRGGATNGVHLLDFASGELTLLHHPKRTGPLTGSTTAKSIVRTFLFGSMDMREEEPSGALYRLDADLSLHVLKKNIIVSNAPAGALRRDVLFCRYLDGRNLRLGLQHRDRRSLRRTSLLPCRSQRRRRGGWRHRGQRRLSVERAGLRGQAGTPHAGGQGRSHH